MHIIIFLFIYYFLFAVICDYSLSVLSLGAYTNKIHCCHVTLKWPLCDIHTYSVYVGIYYIDKLPRLMSSVFGQPNTLKHFKTRLNQANINLTRLMGSQVKAAN